MSYSYFAEYYDILTENVEYEKRADYFLELFKKHGHDMGLTLDLACGTGTLTLELCKRGVDIFGCDMSVDMLTIFIYIFINNWFSTIILKNINSIKKFLL